VCDPLISGPEDFNALIQPVCERYKNEHFSSIKIRTLLTSKFFANDRFVKVRYYKHHFLKLDQTPDQLKKNHRSCVRQRITRSQKSELVVKKGAVDTDLNKFYFPYVISLKWLGLPSQPYRFLQNLWEHFYESGNMELLLAEKTGRA
jgi:hypothetical protein